MANFKEISPDAPVAEKLLNWVDNRFPASKLYKEHLSEYYAPKNFNFWYIFGSLAQFERDLIRERTHAGLKAARRATLPSVPWQRCQFHLQQNAMHYVPKVSLRSTVATELREILHAPSRPQSETLLRTMVAKYRASAQELAAWLEASVPESLTVLALPPEHRPRLRTSNAAERLNQEIKRRTRVARVFPNPASLLRLVSAVLNEISDDWESSKTYLNMNPPSHQKAA